MKRTQCTASLITLLFFSTGIFMLALAPFVSAGNKPDLICSWRDRQVTIDGDSGEWEGSFKSLEKPGFVMGISNDQDYLYICLIPQKRETRAQMLHLGFTLWFDPAGGNAKAFGIGFPLGFSGGAGMGQPMGRESASEADRSQAMLQEANSELEILVTRTAERHRIPVRVAEGIEAKVNADELRLVYEVKIPLTKSQLHPYAIGASNGQIIGIGMETPEFHPDKSKRGNKPEGEWGGPGGEAGVSGGGGMGGPGGGGMGGPGGDHVSPPKPVKFWMTVQLASKSPSTPQ